MAQSATTDPATTITGSSAVLNGTVNPDGINSEAYFEYGLTTSYGLTTFPTQVGAGVVGVPVLRKVAGLSNLTDYHFRVVLDSAPPPPVPGDFGFLLPARIAVSAGSTTNVSTYAALAAAVNAAAGGDIVNLTANINGGGATWVVTKNASGGTVTVTCDPGVTISNFAQIDIRGSNLRFQGLDVGNATIDNFKIDVTAHDIEIDGCLIHDATRQGILVSSSAYNIQIWNNTIYNNGSTLNLDHGIYFSYCRGNCVVANNVFYDNWAYNVQLYPDCPNIIFTCNTVDGYTPQPMQRGGVVVGSESGLTDNIIVVGLITTNGATYGIGPYDPSGGDTNNQVFDSISFGNADTNFQTGGGLVYSNCLQVDPLYVDQPSHDYHLAGGSPAIDLCVLRPGYVPPFDIEGNPRVTADAGAYAA